MSNGYERPAIAGSGTIATGLAACGDGARRSQAARPQRRVRLARRGERREARRQDRRRGLREPQGDDRRRRSGRLRRDHRDDRRGPRRSRARSSPSSPKPHPELTSRRRPRRSVAEIAEASGTRAGSTACTSSTRCRGWRSSSSACPKASAREPATGPAPYHGARQDRRRGAGHGRLHRQPPALSLPVRRGPLHGARPGSSPMRSTPR